MRLRRRTSESRSGTRACAPLLSVALLATGVASAGVALPASAAAAPTASPAVEAGVTRPGEPVTVRAAYDPTGTPRHSGAVRDRMAPRATAGLVDTATITVSYGPGFDTAARTAFQAAVDVWKKRVVSRVPIRIQAEWTPFAEEDVLGQAGPSGFRRNFTGAPSAGTYYPEALANTLAGRDIDPFTPEIRASFNSTFPAWYKGTDGRPGAMNYDFMSVVLHELGHGFGFVGTFDGLNPPSYETDTDRGYWGLGGPGDSPTSFDRFAVDRTGASALNTALYPNGSLALGGLLRGANGGMFWNGAKAVANNGGIRPRLYTPTLFAPGSSYSHLDEAAYPAGTPNALMTPYLTNNESIHDVGPVVLGMMTDIGWSSVTSPATSAILERYTALGGSTGVLGPATSSELIAKDGVGRYMTFRNGAIYWSAASGAREVHGLIRSKWTTLKGEIGFLRYPTTDERIALDNVGRYNDFQGGSVYWSPATGAFELHGLIRSKWLQMNSVKGLLRYPTTDERVTPNGVGRYNHFQGGSVYWSPATGAREIHGLIRSRWAALGWEAGRLGFPTSDEFAVAEGRRSNFQRGSITYVARTGALVVRYV